MNKFVYLELKKKWNRSTLVVCALFLVIITLPLFNYARIDVLDDEGNVHSGIGGWSILRERTVPLEGVMTTEHLFEKRELYQNSVDKEFIEGENDLEKKTGIKLEYPQNQLHWTLNFPYHTMGTTMYNDFNLTDDQIINFYDDWKDSFSGFLSDENNGCSYTAEQIEKISERVEDVATPFVFKYNMGWQYFRIGLATTLYLFFIFLSFIHLDSFSKNNTKGIDQIVLSTKESRRKLIRSKITAACIISTIAYGIYVGAIAIFIFIVYSFYGWDTSIQLGTDTFYSLNMLQECGIYVLIGYFATIVTTHIILFLSLLVKRSGPALVIAASYFYLVETYRMSPVGITKKIGIFMPQNFVNDLLDVRKLFFIGDIMMPYAVVTLLLGTSYMIVLKLSMSLMMKRYYLH